MTVNFDDLKNKPEAPVDTHATTAFLIVQDTNGQWTAEGNYMEKSYILERPSTLDDIIGGCAAVSVGCTAQQTAMATAFVMAQQAQAMQKQFAAQQSMASLDPKKMRL